MKLTSELPRFQPSSLFYSFRFFPAERQVFEKKEDLSTSEWAEKHRSVLKSAIPGPWRNNNNPPLVGIMNASDRKGTFKRTRTIVICKAVQSGGSESIYNILFKRMDRSAQNALLVMENERKTSRIMGQRVIPTIRQMPRLTEQISDNPDDISKYSITLRTGFNLNIGWSRSRAAVSSDPCQTVILDEIDKYTHPLNIEEAKDRTTTFRHDGLNIIVSTPGLTGGPIDTELKLCDTIMQYHPKCPNCGRIQVMEFERFTWPDKGKASKPEEKKLLANIIQREKTARYLCVECETPWDDYMRTEAVRLGFEHNYFGWKMKDEIDFPVAIGFHFPAWVSPFKSLSDIVARWLRAQEPVEGRKQMWHNNEAAEPWGKEKQENIEIEPILKRREKYTVVPVRAVLLIASVDVQDDRLECLIKAYGPGRESWGIDKSIIYGNPEGVDIWEKLDFYLSRAWPHETGVNLSIRLAFIDAGHLFRRICEYTKPRFERNIFASRGSNNPLHELISREPSVKNNLRAPVFFIGTNEGKSKLFSRIAVQAPGPLYMHYNHNFDEEYFRQMLQSEIPVWSRGLKIWKKITSDVRNEALDLEVYNLAAIELLDPDFEEETKALHNLKSELGKSDTTESKEEEQPAETASWLKETSREGRKRGGWLRG